MKTRVLFKLLFTFLFSVSLGIFTSQAQDFVLNGNAFYLGDDCYRLTQNLNTQLGSAWFPEEIDLNEPFTMEYLMYFGSSNAGADGMCFVLQNNGLAATGVGGGGVGYGSMTGNSVAVEFDTWQNPEEGDPFNDHIGIISGGNSSHTGLTALSPAVQASLTAANIEDNQDHFVEITWDPETFELAVYFDCELRTTSTTDLINDVFGGDPLVYYGFTGSTGGANNVHRFCIASPPGGVDEEVAICDGGSAVLNVGGDSDASYTWSPADGLDNALIANPTASPEETTLYTVEYTDNCNDIVTSTVTVYVEDLEPEIVGPTVLDCINDTVQLNLEVNPLFDLEFLWTTDGGFIVGNFFSEQIFGISDGTYTVTYSAGDACSGEISVEVIQDITPYTVTIESADDIDCYNDEVTIQGSGSGSDAEFQWSTSDGSIVSGSGNSAVIVNQPGDYTLEVTNPNNGCTSEESIEVDGNLTPPAVEAGLEDSITCANPVITIMGASTSAFNPAAQWTTDNGSILGGENGLAPLVDGPGTYTLTITNLDNGCVGSDQVVIYVSEEGVLDLSDLELPNIITANEDAFNDEFTPYLTSDPELKIEELLDEFTLFVYNRWGTLVYEWKPGGEKWSGQTDGGNDLESGTYYVVFNYEVQCGETESGSVSGYVHLMR